MSLAHGCASGPLPTAVERGEAALSSGDWRGAKTNFIEALQAESRSGRAWFGLARAQWVGRDPEGVLRSLASLSKVDRKLFMGEARATYANALEGATRRRLTTKQSEAALVAVRVLVKIEPERRGLEMLLGRTLISEAARIRWQGEPDRALDLYREACQVAPGKLQAWVGAAEILLERKRGQEAMRLLEVARKAHPTAGQIRTLTIQALGLR
jgi:tetratricopeptide (TPR) repeat protein